jgi:DNA helicase HerA-like ATPase
VGFDKWESLLVLWLNSNEVRLKEHVGIVTSDTSTVQFSFFVTLLKNRTWLGKEDFVLVDHPVLGELCPLLAVVREIRNYEEVVGSTVGEKTVETVAMSDVLGYVDLRDAGARPLRKLYVPPSPGSKVYLPYLEFLEDVFVRDQGGKRFERALNLGTLESKATYRNGDAKPVSFFLSAEDLARRHLLICGLSGAGKTHTAMVIVEELANKTGFPVVVLDAYGEYGSVGVAGTRLKELAAAEPAKAKDYPFDFKVSVYTSDHERTVRTLKKCGVELGRDGRFSVKSVSGHWSKPCDEKAEAQLMDELKEGAKPGQVTVVNAEGLRADERGHFLTCCVKALSRARVNGALEPFVLVVDDAEAVEAGTLETVASEGRKMGVSLCLLLQHPAEMSGTILSQMSTQLIGRTTDTADLECLKNMAGDKCTVLPQLTVGEWIANGITLMRPTKVFVRDRYSLSV